MKVLYEGKEKEIDKLPEGRYIPKSPKFFCSTPPLVNKSELGKRIIDLGYDNEKVEVVGPFKFLDVVIGA